MNVHVFEFFLHQMMYYMNLHGNFLWRYYCFHDREGYFHVLIPEKINENTKMKISFSYVSWLTLSSITRKCASFRSELLIMTNRRFASSKRKLKHMSIFINNYLLFLTGRYLNDHLPISFQLLILFSIQLVELN